MESANRNNIKDLSYSRSPFLEFSYSSVYKLLYKQYLFCHGSLPLEGKYSAREARMALATSPSFLAALSIFVKDVIPLWSFLHDPGTIAPSTSVSNVRSGVQFDDDDGLLRMKLY